MESSSQRIKDSGIVSSQILTLLPQGLGKTGKYMGVGLAYMYIHCGNLI